MTDLIHGVGISDNSNEPRPLEFDSTALDVAALVEQDRINAIHNGECTCGNSPPCRWCMLLNDNEGEAFWSGGRKALFEFIEKGRS